MPRAVYIFSPTYPKRTAGFEFLALLFKHLIQSYTAWPNGRPWTETGAALSPQHGSRSCRPSTQWQVHFASTAADLVDTLA